MRRMLPVFGQTNNGTPCVLILFQTLPQVTQIGFSTKGQYSTKPIEFPWDKMWLTFSDWEVVDCMHILSVDAKERGVNA